MTSTSPLLDARPRLRPDVMLGPGLHKGPAIVHNVKDRRTGRYFQVGSREHFVMSRLTGTRTLAEVGEDYVRHFGRRLDERRWRQILTVLADRRLLAGTAMPDELDHLAETAKRASVGNRTVLRARLPLVDPDRFLSWLAPRMGALFSRRFALPVMILGVLVEIMVTTQLGNLVHQTERLRHAPAAFGLTIAMCWLSIIVHEVAHGLACKHFGGSADEIGLMWRFPILAPYCNANDVVLMENRWHRVLTAFAGVFTTLLLLIPFAVMWLLFPVDTTAADFAATMLLVGTANVMINLLPVFQLDGYFMLNHALGMQNLRRESHRFVLYRAQRWLGRRGETVGYPSGLSRIYAGYACVSLSIGTAATLGAGWWLFARLRPPLGTALAAGAMLAVALLGSAAAVVAARQRRHRGGG